MDTTSWRRMVFWPGKESPMVRLKKLIHGMEYLVTWNCRHIANAQIQRAVAMVCREAGYEPAVICTPEELMGV
jgi:hypothetical protein